MFTTSLKALGSRGLLLTGSAGRIAGQSMSEVHVWRGESAVLVFWCNPAPSLRFTVSARLCVTAFASLTLAADSMIYYSIHTCRLMCAHTQPLGTLMMGQKEEVVPPEELSRAKCNCIGGQESNKALMEPNYCRYAFRDSPVQSFQCSYYIFGLRVYNSIFSVYLCLFATVFCCAVPNHLKHRHC